MPTTGLRTPADIVAAAAGLLGFAPTNSIVAYMLHRDTSHGLLMRCAIRGRVIPSRGIGTATISFIRRPGPIC